MQKFIYVFNKDTCKKLLSLQYKLIKQDAIRNIYVFLNDKESLDFSQSDFSFALSDILTF